MRAAVLTEVENIDIREVEDPRPGPGEVLVRVRLGGICGSDHTLYRGRFGVPLPVIPGHEAVGTIEETGEGVAQLEVGQRVTIQPNFSCGTCRQCAAGHGNLCPSKTRLGVDTNGVFAELVKVPARYVWPVPDEIPDEVAVFTEPLAVGVHAMKIAAPERGDRVLIFGAGIMGLLVQQLAALQGAEVTACDLVQERLSLAGQLGARNVVGPDEAGELFGNAFDLIYETSGAPSALSQVLPLAAPRGKIVVLSLPSAEHPVSAVQIVRKELQICGSLIYTDEFPESLDILKGRRIRTDLLTTGRIPLPELNQVLGEFSAPTRVKTLVDIRFDGQ